MATDEMNATPGAAAAGSPGHPVTLPPPPAAPSIGRAWCYLVLLSIQRQARARQTVGIALGLLLLMTTIVALIAAADRWTIANNRTGRDQPTYNQWLARLAVEGKLAAAGSGPGTAVVDAVTAAHGAALRASGLSVFSRWIMFPIFVGFLLPVWSLCFATESLGGEREARSLVWLLSRPLPRPAIYLAKFVALLPWVIGFNVGGLAVLCVVAGAPGRQAFLLYWPPVVAASFAFCALFQLMGAVFSRPAIVAIVYTFFLEIVVSTMPGYMKRVSIGFYTRCLMFDSAEAFGMARPEKSSIYLPVTTPQAWIVLLGVTVALLLAGMVVFARSEYWEDL